MQLRLKIDIPTFFYSILFLTFCTASGLKAAELGEGTDLEGFLRDDEIATFALLPLTGRHSDGDISTVIMSWIKSRTLEMLREECSLASLRLALVEQKYYEVIALAMASSGTKCQAKIIDALRQSLGKSAKHNALAAYAVYASFNFGKDPSPEAVNAGEIFVNELEKNGFDQDAIARVPNFVEQLKESIAFERIDLFRSPKQ